MCMDQKNNYRSIENTHIATQISSCQEIQIMRMET